MRTEGDVIRSKIDPSGICGKRVTINSVLCTKCDQWIHGMCFKLKKVTSSGARFFVCNKCDKGTDGAGEVQQEVMRDEVETVKGFSYLGDRLNASRRCETAVTAKTRLVSKKLKRVWRNTVRKKILFADEKKRI